MRPIRVLFATAAALALAAPPSPSRAGGFGQSEPEVEPPPRRLRLPHPLPGPAAEAWLRLQEPVDLAFGEEVALADFLAFVREVGRPEGDDDAEPLRVYLDPLGLQEAERSASSPVTIELPRVPIASALELVLGPLGLTFGVRPDGVVVVDSADSIRAHVEPTAPVPPAYARAWIKLNRPAALKFPAETPLEDVLRQATRATAGPEGEKGLAFHVDPLGLQSVERTMTSPVAIDVEGIPLASGLELALGQLGLAFRVRPDGLVVVDSAEKIEAQERLAAEAAETPEQLRYRLEVAKLRSEIARMEAASRQQGRGMGGMMGGPLPAGMSAPGGQGMR